MRSYDTIGNQILSADSYKPSHFLQYPPDSTHQFAYLEARKGARYPATLAFGLQYILKRYFDHDDCPLTPQEVLIAEEFWKAHGVPFNTAGWMRIVDEHSGRLPLLIKAVPEGSLIPVDNALVTVESMDPQLGWLVTYVETMLERVWYPMTVATRSFFCKAVILRYLQQTSDDPNFEINFKLHDFGGRGSTTDESAGVAGMAHLLNFKGTDTPEGISQANLYYPQHTVKVHDFEMHGFSIPAMEHSTIISWGKGGEIEAFRNMMRRCKELGFMMIAAPADSYDHFNAVENIWCGELLQEVKDSGMTVVIRPDSGDPASINRQTLQVMARKLGSEMKVNSKGFMVLPDYFRIIQGDGNDDETSIDKVLASVTGAGFSASNISFGMGGGLHQKLDRDTQRFAYKLSAIERDGAWHDVRKIPKTDPSKASKGGRIATKLVKNAPVVGWNPKIVGFDTVNENDTWVEAPYGDYDLEDIMEVVFKDGSVRVDESFETIQKRASEHLK